MLVVALDAGQGHLVSAPGALDLDPVDHGRSGPPLRGPEHDQRPAGASTVPVAAPGSRLDTADTRPGPRQRVREPVVHPGQVVPGDLDDVVPVPFQQRPDLGGILACQHGGARDLRPVQVQDREHRAVPRGVEEGDALPGTLQRAGLRLSVSDHGQGDQVRVVHDGPEGVDQDIAQLTAFVDRPGRRNRHVAGDTSRGGELTEQPAQALGVLRDVGIDLRVGALEVARRDQRRTTVAGAGEIDHLLTGALDQPGGMRVDEGQAGTRAPVPEQSGLDVIRRQGLSQERVGQQVDLADRQVVVGPPPGVRDGDLVGARSRQRLDQVLGGCPGLANGGHGRSFSPLPCSRA